jgi:hypothetical protein
MIQRLSRRSTNNTKISHARVADPQEQARFTTIWSKPKNLAARSRCMPSLPEALLSLVRENRYGLVMIALAADHGWLRKSLDDVHSLLRQVPCRVFLVASQAIPQEAEQ